MSDRLNEILVKLVREVEVYTDDEVMSRADTELLLEAKQALQSYIDTKELKARIDEVERAIADRRFRSSVKIKRLDYLESRLAELKLKGEKE